MKSLSLKTSMLVVAMALGTSAAHAEAGDTFIRIRGIMVAPTESSGGILPTFPTEEVKVNNSVMPEVDITHMVSNNVGLELIAATTKHNASGTSGTTGGIGKLASTWVLPPTLTVQYHFAPEAKVRPYVGAGVNYMLFYGGSNKNGFNLKIDDGFGLAAQAGLDVATSGPWSVNLDVKKIFFTTDAVDRKSGLKSKVHLDPWVLSAGFGYRF